jgi:hypothetical protein
MSRCHLAQWGGCPRFAGFKHPAANTSEGSLEICKSQYNCPTHCTLHILALKANNAQIMSLPRAFMVILRPIHLHRPRTAPILGQNGSGLERGPRVRCRLLKLWISPGPINLVQVGRGAIDALGYECKYESPLTTPTLYSRISLRMSLEWD